MKQDDVKATQIERFYKDAIKSIKAEIRRFIEYDEDGKLLDDTLRVWQVEEIFKKYLG